MHSTVHVLQLNATLPATPVLSGGRSVIHVSVGGLTAVVGLGNGVELLLPSSVPQH